VAPLAQRPFRASTKAFRPFLVTVEALYAGAFTAALLQLALEELVATWSPSWVYALHSGALLREGEERTRNKRREERERALRIVADAKAARQQRLAAASAASAAATPSVRASSRSKQASKKRGATNRSGVADASVLDASALQPVLPQQSPAFQPADSSQPLLPPTSHANQPTTALPQDSLPSPPPAAFASARRVVSRTLFPYERVRHRWWQKRSSSDETSAAFAAQPDIFAKRLGDTVCFYDMHAADGETAADTLQPPTNGNLAATDTGAHRSTADATTTRRGDEDAPSSSSSSASSSSASSSSAASSAPIVPSGSLPSGAALTSLAWLVHNAGLVMSAPSELADAMTSMELSCRLADSDATGNASSGTPAKGSSAPLLPLATRPVLQKIWAMRMHDLVLCFPTAVAHSSHGSGTGAMVRIDEAVEHTLRSSFDDDASFESSLAPPPPPPAAHSLAEVLVSLRPMMASLDVHYAFVASINERKERSRQKGAK
jgi:hypothetical protein